MTQRGLDTNFSNFGKDFQEKLVYHLTTDRVFCDRMSEVLKVEHLELKHLQVFTRILFDYRDKFRKHPSKETILTLLRTQMDEEGEATKKLVSQFYGRVSNDEIKGDDETFIKEQALDFCRKQAVQEAMLLSLEKINSAHFDDVSKLINDALKKGEDSDLGHDYFQDFEKRYDEKFAYSGISTGWPHFDEIMEGGGLPKKHLGLVVGGAGRGKSMCLTHLACVASLNEYNVLYLTLELGEEMIGKRCDALITEIGLNDLRSNKDEVHRILRTKMMGNLNIKHYPTRQLSINGIRALIEKAERMDKKPDVVIVDYADLLKTDVRGEKWEVLETLYEELRGIAGEFEVALWTGSQTNRSGTHEGTSTDDGIAGSLGKLRVIDFGFRILRNNEDKEKNYAKFEVFKNRLGPDGIYFDVCFDTSMVKIETLGKHDAQKEQQNSIQAFVQRKEKNKIAREEAMKKLIEMRKNNHLER